MADEAAVYSFFCSGTVYNIKKKQLDKRIYEIQMPELYNSKFKICNFKHEESMI